MHFALKEIQQESKLLIISRTHSVSPLAVPPTIPSPFLSTCGKGWLGPSGDSLLYIESLSPKREVKMEGF